MPELSSAQEPVVILLAASQTPGPAIAKAFAKSGARVILVDGDGKALTRIAAIDPDQIETLAIEDFRSDAAGLLRDAWGDQPLRMVINLMPLAHPFAITAQMRVLSATLRTTLRGLVAGKGCIVNLVARPDDPLALIGQGMLAALEAGSTALARAVRPHPVKIHVLSLPSDAPEAALDTLKQLSTNDGSKIESTTFNLS